MGEVMIAFLLLTLWGLFLTFTAHSVIQGVVGLVLVTLAYLATWGD